MLSKIYNGVMILMYLIDFMVESFEVLIIKIKDKGYVFGIVIELMDEIRLLK